MGPALAQRVDTGLDHIGRRIEIGLADFQMNDLLALALESACLVQNFKGSFSAQPRHASGQAEFVLSSISHGANR